ncbi:probable flavin-containing monooxygenase 1 isoform X2 [Tripterygium wilfordii]|uniref:probable flavin-containing monooxygenase 1 isoform X2 n=1 Tax=Tripterygium wilfordii TaxID=458696 RepID=UPI0018F8588C|nr:probable flavin-containing monooxygenase 1 isoform X2 [Tripterygium wilfordii]XP_038699238.1 probable flavin-containing monooxygenase 1 isoform X2 [Tripterygium wilfordii]XP_038699239.1 probable flavin-containing monooxygenase 1 isoform X2 [Tripterygium wilfordii]
MKRVAIIGAGVSGLLACKYSVEKGFNPMVFEAEECVGGIWACTIESTELQNPKQGYQFSDFPWSSSVKEIFPNHTKVMEYLESYARHFGIYQYINFNSKVISIDYVGESNEEMESWSLWGGKGKPFCSKGKWLVEVQDTKICSRKVYEFEFVILCIGKYSGLPNIPEFPPNQGPEVFNGKVLHSMDYSAMDDARAKKLIEGKRVAVIGSLKSAVDIAAECANTNGAQYPCLMIQRTVHWTLPSSSLWGINIGYLYGNRFSQTLVHSSGQTFMSSLLVALLAPLRWGISKFAEIYTRWKLPLKKFNMLPEHSFLEDLFSCQTLKLPEKFYDKVEEGSIILKKSQNYRFCREGLIIDGETQTLQTDVVIFATGYNSDQKLSNIFKSLIFKKSVIGSQTSVVPLYRHIIHPRIPQLAVIGQLGLSSLGAAEIKCQWLAHFLDGNIELPSIREMEKDVVVWENHMKKYSGKYFMKGCALFTIWYNDQMCKDMGCKSRRKNGFFAEWFEPYSAMDYADLSLSRHSSVD